MASRRLDCGPKGSSRDREKPAPLTVGLGANPCISEPQCSPSGEWVSELPKLTLQNATRGMDLTYVHLQEDDNTLKVVNATLKKNVETSYFTANRQRDQRTVCMLWPHGGAQVAGKQAGQEGLRPRCTGLLLSIATESPEVCEFVKWRHLLVRYWDLPPTRTSCFRMESECDQMLWRKQNRWVLDRIGLQDRRL